MIAKNRTKKCHVISFLVESSQGTIEVEPNYCKNENDINNSLGRIPIVYLKKCNDKVCSFIVSPPPKGFAFF